MAMAAETLDGVARDGVEAAITPDELCRRFAPQVARFAAVLSATSSDAEDLAQEALLKAVRALPSYRPNRAPIEAWLWRIVVNASHDARRSRLRRVALLLRLAAAPAPPAADAEEIALTRAANDDLRRALAGLSRHDRTLIAMRFGADLEIDEMAAALESSAAATRKAVERALHRLRSQLQEGPHA
jgi:RNA polymerase sigma factor (sigma-70 family)